MKDLIDLFDYAAAEAAKSDGMELASTNQPGSLAMARAIAIELATQHGDTNADDVGREMINRGYPATGPWAGSIFKGDAWQFTGERIRSARVANHGREIKVWRLAP